MFITFKSKKEYYEHERIGTKNFTVRFTDDWGDDRWKMFNKANMVVIECVDYDSNFAREIKYKGIYKNLAMIGW